MANIAKVKVSVERFDKKKKARIETWFVPFKERMRVLDAIFNIQEKDGTLAIRWNCRAGACGSCAIEIDGKPSLACKTEITEEMKHVHLSPLKAYPVIKDFIIDRTRPDKDLEKLKPYFIPDKEFAKQKGFWKIFDHEIQKSGEMKQCIDCLICQDSCQAILNSKLGYTGPRNIVKAAGMDKHPRSGFSRTHLLEDVKLCNVTRCCSENCPEDIRITEHAIIPLKESLVSEMGIIKLIKRWKH